MPDNEDDNCSTLDLQPMFEEGEMEVISDGGPGETEGGMDEDTLELYRYLCDKDD